MLYNFLLRLLGRDVDALIAFIDKVRDKLTELVIQSASEIGEIDALIEQTIENGERAIEKVKQDVNAEVLAGRTKIAEIEARVERLKAVGNLLG